MFKYFYILTVFAVMVFPLSAQYSYMPGDYLVDELIDSYSRAGKVFPVSGFPLSKKDLYKYAVNIGNSEIVDKLEYEPDTVVFEQTLKFNYEHYFRTKDGWADFSRLFLDTPDLMNLTLSTQKDGMGGVYIKAGNKREYDPDNLFYSSNFFSSESKNPIASENEIIREGYFYYMFDSFDFVLGRSKVHYGASNFSSLYPSKIIPFIDALSYKFTLGNLQMQSYIATLENREADIDVAEPTNAKFGENTIIATMHRFEYSWSKVRASIGAQSFLVRTNNGFLLGDFLPVFSWHNTVVGEHNMSLIGDISYIPYPGLGFYFMGGFDDINASDMVGIDDSELPTIPAWIFGAEYQPVFTELVSKVSLEVGKTHYLWGNFYADDPDLIDRNSLAKAIYRYKTDSGYTAIPMTSPYGPGSFWCDLKIAANKIYGFTPEFNVLFLSQIEGVDLFNTPYERADDTMESADKIKTVNANMSISYDFAKLGNYYVKAGYFNQDGTSWMEFTLGGSVEFNFKHRSEELNIE